MFRQLTDETVYRHLDPTRQGRSELHIGLYPLLADDTCRLLASDFDGKDGSNWRADANAYVTACRKVGIPARVEVSRSGTGAHAWAFFTVPVVAAIARALGMGLLRRRSTPAGGALLGRHQPRTGMRRLSIGFTHERARCPSRPNNRL